MFSLRVQLILHIGLWENGTDVMRQLTIEYKVGGCYVMTKSILPLFCPRGQNAIKFFCPRLK